MHREERQHPDQWFGARQQANGSLPRRPAGGGGERRPSAYGTFGHVAFHWCGRKQGILADPPCDLVDQNRNVVRRVVAGQTGGQRCRTQRIGVRGSQPHRLDPIAWVDPIDAQMEKPGEMARITGRARGADRQMLFAAIDPLQRQDRRPDTAATLHQLPDQLGEQVADHLLDRLGRADRFEQAETGDGLSCGTTGTIGSGTRPSASSRRRTLAMPSRRASGPRGSGRRSAIRSSPTGSPPLLLPGSGGVRQG